MTPSSRTRLSRMAFAAASALSFIACPGPPEPPRKDVANYQMLNLDQGSLVELRVSTNGACEVLPDPIRPPVPLASPRLVLHDPVRRRCYFLESPSSGPRVTSYLYDPFERTFDAASRTSTPLAFPGGTLQALPVRGRTDFSTLLWGTGAPFLVGVQPTDSGTLELAGQLPVLTQAPKMVAQEGDLLCVGTTDGSIQAYRIQKGTPAQPLMALPDSGPLVGLVQESKGLWVLRQSPSRLDYYATGASGPSTTPDASMPLVGTPLAMTRFHGGGILLTTRSPQKVTAYRLQNGRIELAEERAAIRGDFALPVAFRREDIPQQASQWGQVLLHPTSGEGAIANSTLGLQHFSLPGGQYAPVTLRWIDF